MLIALVLMDRGLMFHRASYHPAPREIAAGFLRYPKHVLHGIGRDLAVGPRARSQLDIDIDPNQKIVAR